MKLLTALLALGLSLGAVAQTFILQQKTNLADLNICQLNHQKIINKFSAAADYQIARLINGITVETDDGTADFQLKMYKDLLADLIIKKIVYSELTKQLAAQKLSEFYSQKSNSSKDILSTENIGSNLDAQLPSVLKTVAHNKKINITETELQGLSNYITKQSIKYKALGYTRTIGSNIITGMVTIQGGKLILKSFTLSLGTKILTSIGTAVVLDLLTMPLKGGRLPPEDLWTDLLKEYPSLIIMPELMRKGGIKDHPWMTHCYAIQRRTQSMENSLKKALQLDEGSFISQVTNISKLDEELPETEQVPKFDFKTPIMPRDNTYVKPSVRVYEFQAPFWAYKLP